MNLDTKIDTNKVVTFLAVLTVVTVSFMMIFFLFKSNETVDESSNTSNVVEIKKLLNEDKIPVKVNKSESSAQFHIDEIPAKEYYWIPRFVEQYPQLKPIVKTMMKDGFVSNKEYDNFHTFVSNFRKKDALRNLDKHKQEILDLVN